MSEGSNRGPRRDAVRNRELLLDSAQRLLRERGTKVSSLAITEGAGLAAGTLYRHFPTREDLLNYLTHASFEQVLANARAAESNGTTATEALRQFIEAAISQRNQLVLPLHGGPPLTSPRTRTVRKHVHQIIQRIIDRGRADGTITRDVTPHEIVVFGAMLAQPRRSDPGWDATCRRLLATYLAGLGSDTSGD
jgi:AcrR family transcriptional regulator